MPQPDTSSVSPVFIEWQPDFAKKIIVTADWKTSISTSQNGGEQRARWRLRPRYTIDYTIAALSIAEFSKRRSSYITELQSPVVVPIWTHNYALSSMSDVNTAQLGISLTNKKFKLGSYAYFVDPTGSLATCFRVITAVNSTSLSLAAGSHPNYVAGALVYPCIVGRHKATGGGFDLVRAHQSDELISIEEL